MYPCCNFLCWDALTGWILANRSVSFPRTGQPGCGVGLEIGGSSALQKAQLCLVLMEIIQKTEVMCRKKLLFLNVLIWRRRADYLYFFLYNFQLEKDELETSLIATMGDLGQAPWFLDSQIFCSWLFCMLLYEQQWPNFKSTSEWVLALLT